MQTSQTDKDHASHITQPREPGKSIAPTPNIAHLAHSSPHSDRRLFSGRTRARARSVWEQLRFGRWSRGDDASSYARGTTQAAGSCVAAALQEIQTCRGRRERSYLLIGLRCGASRHPSPCHLKTLSSSLSSVRRLDCCLHTLTQGGTGDTLCLKYSSIRKATR